MESILNNPDNALELLDMTAGILLLLDEKGLCIDVKSPSKRVWFLQEDILKGKNLLMYMPPSTLREFYPNFKKVLAEHIVSSQNYEMLMRGQTYYFNCTMQYYNGLVLCQCRDTTQKSLEQIELIKRNKEMTEIQEIAMIGTWIYNSEINVLRYTGHGGVMEHNGVIDLDLSTYSGYVLPDDRKNFNEWIVNNKNGKIGETVNFRIRFDNKIFYMKARTLSYEYLDNGAFIAEGYAHNVTDIQKSRNDVNMLTHAINNAVEYIAAVNLDGKLIFANRKLRKSMNLSMQDDVTQTKIWELYSIVDSPEMWERIVKNTKEGNLEKGWIMLNPLQLFPEVLAIETNAFWVTDDNGNESIWFFGRDVTDSVEAARKLKEAKENAERSERLKSAFLANMSHEIRTPLNAIVGFSRIISEVESPEDKAEFCRIIEENNDRLLHLINELLDISKIEADMVKFNIQPIGMNELCAEVYHAFELRCPPEIHLINEATGKEHFAMADKNRTIQIVSNLIDNALKFTKHGSICFGYKVKGKFIEIYATDTGIGIEPEQLDTIFNRFVKANENIQGTGLGLSICKMLVEKMVGQISVESQFGKGTTFKFTLPAQ
ncbi:MAG: PAS domain-containing sensor histidine kinase [Bacteroidaceae bacterium]|nr:PAS domain-containing sensor histidine kinase [Bacteroidaceae bacterium]